MKKILIVVLLSVLISGCVQEQEEPIGGQRDEYGCLGPAGYSWNDDLQLCARAWEIVSDEQIQAIRKATENIADRHGLTIVEYITKDCEGCFILNFNRFEEQMVITLENWEII